MLHPFYAGKEGEIANAKIEQWIHDEYGRSSGLQKSDYVVHLDPLLVDSNGKQIDIARYAGTAVHIYIRFIPFGGQVEAFKSCLTRIFEDRKTLKQLLRPKGIALRKDMIKWYGIEETFVGLPEINKKKHVHNCKTETVNYVRVTDVPTNRSVMVAVINGDAFSARDEAERRLYGER